MTNQFEARLNLMGMLIQGREVLAKKIERFERMEEDIQTISIEFGNEYIYDAETKEILLKNTLEIFRKQLEERDNEIKEFKF